jgi:hydroxymethylbilane synthase
MIRSAAAARAAQRPASAACVTAERAMLAALDGSCRTPIAGLATIDGDRLSLDALLLAPDGSAERRDRGAGAVAEAAAIGKQVGERLRREAGPEFGLRDTRDQLPKHHRPAIAYRPLQRSIPL